MRMASGRADERVHNRKEWIRVVYYRKFVSFFAYLFISFYCYWLFAFAFISVNIGDYREMMLMPIQMQISKIA